MTTSSVVLPESPEDAAAQVQVLLDYLATADLSGCDNATLVGLAESQERALRRMNAVANRSLVEINHRNLSRELGFRSLVSFMSRHLRITDTSRRRQQMEHLGEMLSGTGEVLAPKCPSLAQAFVDGDVGAGHVSAVLEVMDRIPHRTPHDVREAAETTMAQHAREFAPSEITQIGTRLIAHLDPDGELTDERDRSQRRNLWANRQDSQLMSKLTGHLTPATRAKLDVVLAVWAQAGMNNPDDALSPRGVPDGVDAQALRAAADRDSRSVAQRNHDAFDAMLTAVVDGGALGKSHRGLPTQVVIRVDEKDLRAGAGMATTASGSLLPLKDAVELAGAAQQHLAVFAEHSAVPLYLGRARRLASLGQRLASFASPGGEHCSAPGCDQPAIRVEMHHGDRDWVDGGTTDIDTLTPACPKHNRMVGPKPGQYTTSLIRSGPDTGRTAWELNVWPGMPHHLPRINRIPDVVADFRAHLDTVRADIYPRTTSSDPPKPPPPPPPPARVDFLWCPYVPEDNTAA